MHLDLRDRSVTCARDAEGVAGRDEVLLDGDENLLQGTAFEADGYTVVPFLSEPDWAALKAAAVERVRSLLIEGGAVVPDGFTPDVYHQVVGDNLDLHVTIARRMAAGFPVSEMGIDPQRLVERIEEILGKRLTLRYPENGEEIYCMRTVRPRSHDNNPLHRDSWLPHLRNGVNLYIPIAGSDEHSSLPLVPGSHHWSEAETLRTEGGAKIETVQFTVPSVVAAKRPLHPVRPNPGENEVLVFSPYMLHGGASNPSEDTTRLSLEIRLWKATG